MKTKYDRMTKEEKKKLVEKYKRTEAGLAMMNRLLRLQITGIISFVLSIGLFVFHFKTIEMMDYLTIIPLFLASLLFMMMSYKLKRKVLNKFAVKNK